MEKNYLEKSLKRFLKRRVKVTLGLVVAFLITGAIAYAEKIETKLEDGSWVITTTDGTTLGMETFAKTDKYKDEDGNIKIQFGTEEEICTGPNAGGFIQGGGAEHQGNIELNFVNYTNVGNKNNEAIIGGTYSVSQDKVDGDIILNFENNNVIDGNIVGAGGSLVTGNSIINISGNLTLSEGDDNLSITAGPSWKSSGAIATVQGNTLVAIKDAEVSLNGIGTNSIQGGAFRGAAYRGTILGTSGVIIENSNIELKGSDSGTTINGGTGEQGSYVIIDNKDGKKVIAKNIEGGNASKGTSRVDLIGGVIEGDINGGSGSLGAGVYYGADTKYLEITGNIKGGTSRTGNTVDFSNSGNVTINGNITGGSSSQGSNEILLNDTIVNGNISGADGKVGKNTYIEITGENTKISGTITGGSTSKYGIVKGNSLIRFDLDSTKEVKGFIAGYTQGESTLVLSDKLKEFDSNLIEAERDEDSTAQSFDYVIFEGDAEITGTFENLKALEDEGKLTDSVTIKGEDGTNLVITENIDVEHLGYHVGDGGTITIMGENNIEMVTGDGEFILHSEITEDGVVYKGKLNADKVDSSVTIGTDLNADELRVAENHNIDKILKDLSDSVKTLNSSKQDQVLKIHEGKLFGEITGEINIDKFEEKIVNQNVAPKSSTILDLEAASTATILTWRQEMDSLNKRMSELRDPQAEHGVWARVYSGNINNDDLDTDYNTYQVGYDKKYAVDNGSVFIGGFVSYTESESDLRYGDSENYSVGLGVYGSWLGNDNQYVDIIFKQSYLNTEFDIVSKDGNFISDNDFNNWGTSLSGTYGRRYDLNHDCFIQPYMNLTLGMLWGDSYNTGNSNIEVEQDDVLSGLASIGATIGHQIGDKGYLYVRGAVVHEFFGDMDVDYKSENQAGTARLSSSVDDLEDTWIEFGAGVAYRVKDGINVYFDLQKTGNASYNTNWQGSLGFRWEI